MKYYTCCANSGQKFTKNWVIVAQFYLKNYNVKKIVYKTQNYSGYFCDATYAKRADLYMLNGCNFTRNYSRK